MLIATNVSMAQELKFGDSEVIQEIKPNSSDVPVEGANKTYNICSPATTEWVYMDFLIWYNYIGFQKTSLDILVTPSKPLIMILAVEILKIESSVIVAYIWYIL